VSEYKGSGQKEDRGTVERKAWSLDLGTAHANDMKNTEIFEGVERIKRSERERRMTNQCDGIVKRKSGRFRYGEITFL